MLLEEPEDVFLHYALGLELVKESRYQEAIATFSHVIELDNTYTAAYYQLGLIFRDLDIVDVARTYFIRGQEQARLQKDMKTAGEFAEALELLD